MAARVVHDLELVEIEIENRIRRLARLRALERTLETRLEFAPVDELREDVVARGVAETPVQLARLADVVEHEHAAGHATDRIANRRGRALDLELVAVAANQKRGTYGLDRP